MKYATKHNSLIEEINKNLSLMELRVEIIQPKPEHKKTQEMDRLISELYDVAVDAFDKPLPYEAIDSRTRDASYILLLKDRKGRTVGYTVNEQLTLAGHQVNYYATALMRREVQQQGIYQQLNLLRSYLIDAEAIMTRTQNPAVYRSFSRICSQRGYEVNPSGKGISMLARDIALGHSPEADERLIVRGIYFGRSLMNDTPTPKTEEEKRLWRHLNVDLGDALVIVGLRQ